MNFLRKKNIYATSSNIRPNTYIGGVASTINTKALLASKLGIPVARIKMFRVVNDDVQANIIGTYAIPANAFLNNTSITYFRDEENLVYSIGNSSFFGCTFLIEVKFLNLISIGASALRLCSSMLAIDFPLLAVATNNCFQENGAYDFILPNLTTVNNGSFAYCPNAEELNFPSLTTSIGTAHFIGNLAKRFLFPNVVSIGNEGFRTCTNAELIDLSNVSTLGTSVGSQNVFNGVKTDAIIKVPIALMTVNGGSVEADLNIAELDVQYLGTPPPINTEIQGMASILSTKQLLCTKLAVTRSRITNFQIVGNDIKFFLVGNHSIPSGAFQNQIALKKYLDYDGWVVGISLRSFQDCTSAEEFYFPKATSAQGSSFLRCSKPGVIFNMPLLNFINSTGAFSQTGAYSISFPELATISQSGTFATNTLCTSYDLPKLTFMGSGIFVANSAVNLINIPKCTNLGGSALSNGVFTNIKTGCVINVNIATQTANTGAPDGDLDYAITSRSAIVNYIP